MSQSASGNYQFAYLEHDCRGPRLLLLIGTATVGSPIGGEVWQRLTECMGPLGEEKKR